VVLLDEATNNVDPQRCRQTRHGGLRGASLFPVCPCRRDGDLATRHAFDSRMTMTKRNLFRWALAGAAALAASGCAEPGVQTTERTAVIEAGTWGKVYRGGYVEIASVDGVEPGWRLRSAMELAAGDRTAVLYVYLCNYRSVHCYSIAQEQIGFRVEAGHAYRVRAREQLNGSNRFWVWIEDNATGKAVGGALPSPS
jgi:hypothetical protein